MSTIQLANSNKIRWACRRGMLELDLILLPFFEECFIKLTEQQKRSFISLLEFPDPDLYRWLMRSEQHEIPGLSEIIGIVNTYAKRLS